MDKFLSSARLWHSGDIHIPSGHFEIDPVEFPLGMSGRLIFGAGVVGMALGAGVLAFAVPRPGSGAR